MEHFETARSGFEGGGTIPRTKIAVTVMPLVEAVIILILAGWTVNGLASSQEEPFFLPAIGVALTAASLALVGMTVGREIMEIVSITVVAAVYVVHSVFILPQHTAVLFLFLSLTVFVLLFARQRVFYDTVMMSIKGEGDISDRTVTVLKKSVGRLSLFCACVYLLSVLLYNIALELTYGLTTIWSALFFSFLFLLSLLILSLIPK